MKLDTSSGQIPTDSPPKQPKKVQSISCFAQKTVVAPIKPQFKARNSSSAQKFQNIKRTKITGSSINISGQNDWSVIDLAIYAKHQNQDFILIQETHKPGDNDFYIDHPQFKRWRFITSGFKKSKRAGVAILLSPRAFVLEVNRVSDARILSIKVNILGQQLLLTSCYAPDESYSEPSKQIFWRDFNKLLSLRVPVKNVRRIFGGDFNATIVPNSKESPALPGFGEFHPPSCYERTKSTSFNGHALLAAARQYKMFLEQSYFKNRRACHSWTFCSNNATKYRRRLNWFLVDKSVHAHTVSCRSHPNPVNSDHRCIIISVNLPRK